MYLALVCKNHTGDRWSSIWLGIWLSLAYCWLALQLRLLLLLDGQVLIHILQHQLPQRFRIFRPNWNSPSNWGYLAMHWLLRSMHWCWLRLNNLRSYLRYRGFAQTDSWGQSWLIWIYQQESQFPLKVFPPVMDVLSFSAWVFEQLNIGSDTCESHGVNIFLGIGKCKLKLA